MALGREVRELAPGADHGAEPFRFAVLQRGEGPGANGDVQGAKAVDVLQPHHNKRTHVCLYARAPQRPTQSSLKITGLWKKLVFSKVHFQIPCSSSWVHL